MKKYHFDEEHKIPLLLLLGFIISYLLKYGLNLLLANFLEPELYGDYAVATRVLSLCIPLILLGTSAGSKKFFSLYLARGETENIARYTIWNLKLFIISSVITLLAIVSATILLVHLHIQDIKRIEEYHLAIYMLYVAPVAGLVQLVSSALLSLRSYLASSYIPNAGRNLLIFSLFSLAWFLAAELHAIEITGIILIAYIVVLVILVLTLIYRFPQLGQYIQSNLNNDSPSELRKAWSSTSRRLMLNNIVFTATTVVDILVLEILSSNQSLTGHYAAVLTICGSLWIIQSGFSTFIKERISAHPSREQRQELQHIINKVNALQITITLIVCLGLLFFANKLLGHFGPSFLNARIPLIILICASTLAVITSIAPLVLTYNGYEKQVLWVNITTLILLGLSCPLLTYYYSITGTAVSAALTYVIPNLVMVLMAKRYMRIRTCLFI